MKILLATDGSTYSAAAAQTLALMFRTEGTEVLVLQVVEPSSSPRLRKRHVATHQRWPRDCRIS